MTSRGLALVVPALLVFSMTVGDAHADKNEEANVELCQRFYEDVVNRGNVAVVDELMAEDFVEREVLPGLEPTRIRSPTV